MKKNWWKLFILGGVISGLLLRRHFNSPVRRQSGEAAAWPPDKNFGSFPPRIPEDVFDGVNFI
jgi:hypothetical protein